MILQLSLVAVNAIRLLDSSVFRDLEQIPLPSDLLVQEQPQDDAAKQGEDSPGMELAQEINSHVVVIDEDNLTTTIPTEGQGTPQASQGLTLAIASEVSLDTSAVT
nr:hypothetical protein CFP56_67455 [Quercus suber]